MTFNICAVVYCYLVAQMTVVWVFSRLFKNPSVVDVSWSLGLMISGWIYLLNQPVTNRSVMAGLLLSVWAIRLATYLWYSRIRKGHVDKRYVELSDTWKINRALGFFFNFQLQGILIFILSITFYFIPFTQSEALSAMDYSGILLVILGILGESLADYQLQKFKASSAGKVCNVGLWHYSRHPNYFFDWLTWCGFFLLAAQAPGGIFCIVSPILMLLIFTQMTGPLTERSSIASRGQAFIDYQKKTSMFFPWFTR